MASSLTSGVMGAASKVAGLGPSVISYGGSCVTFAFVMLAVVCLKSDRSKSMPVNGRQYHHLATVSLP